MTARKASAAAFGAASARRSPRPTPTAPPAPRPKVKYTVLLDADDSDALDARLIEARRQVGRRVEKSDLVRELLALLEEDPALSGQVYDRLRNR